MVTVSCDVGVGLCSKAAALEKLIIVAATTPRTIAFRFRTLSGERRTRCPHFLTYGHSIPCNSGPQRVRSDKHFDKRLAASCDLMYPPNFVKPIRRLRAS